MTAYTHPKRMSSKLGYWVGEKGSESQVIDEDGVWVGAGITLEASDSPMTIGAQANVVGSGLPISSTATAALSVYSDDNGASIADSVRGVRSRFLLTVDQAGGSIRALQGQLKVLDGVDVATGIYTASQGYVEFAATHAVSSGATMSCFDASVEIGTALTVASGGEFFGIHVETTGAGSITNNGTCAAIGITKATSAAEWPVGIYMAGPHVTTGMRIGDWVAAAATTGGVVFGSDMDVYSDGQLDVIQVHGATNTLLGGSYSAKCGKFRHVAQATGTIEAELYGAIGQVVCKTAVLGLYAAGLMGTIESNGGFHVGDGASSSYPCTAGVIGRPGGASITIDAGSTLAGIAALSNTTSMTTTGDYVGFYVNLCQSTSTAFKYGLYIPTASTRTPIKIGAWSSNTASTGHVLAYLSEDSGSYCSSAIAVHCDDGGAAVTNITTPIFARYLLTVDQSGGGTQAALFAHLKSAGTGTRTYTTGGIRGAYIFTQLGQTALVTSAELVTVNVATTLAAGGLAVGAGCRHAGIDVNIAGDGSITGDGDSAGIIIRAKSAETARWPLGLYIPAGSISTEALRVGAFSASTAGSGHLVSNTNNRIASFYADDNGVGTAGAAFVSVLRGRLLLTGATYVGEQYGLHGTVTYKPAASAALSSYTAGLLGTFEGATGMTVTGGFHAAIIGRVGFGAMQPAISAGAYVAGVVAGNNLAAAATGAGKTAGFVATAFGAIDWDYGLEVVDNTAAVGVHVGTTSGNGIQVVNGALTVGDNYSGVRVAVTAPASSNAYGMAAYFDTTITGTTAGHSYGVGSWINTASTPVLSAEHIIVPFEGGVYTGEAQATARIVFGGQHQAILNGAPASLHAWRLNTTQTITAVIAAANAGSIGFTGGAGTSGTQVGYIPIADIVGTGVVYIRVYDSAT